MTELSTTPQTQGTQPVSTDLTPGTYDQGTGAGSPTLGADKPEEKEKPSSLRDVLADEMKKGAEPEQKPEPEAKAEAKPDPAPEKKEAVTPEKAEPSKSEAKAQPEPPQEGADAASSEDDKTAPPARITEDAKKYWRSTPRAIKAEFQRIEGEISRITQESGEAMRFAEEVKPYRDMAQQAGTTVKAALDRYVDFDKKLYEDFGKGVAAIAKDQGKQPVEAIASVLRAYGLTPQQYAQHVTQNPQAHQVAQPQPRDPALQQVLQQQQQIMQRFQQQDQSAQLNALQSEVANWSQGKPDFKTLEPAIAEILQSGIIDRIHGKGLSVVQRLEAAYRMAGGNALNPDPAPASPAPVPVSAAPNDAGKKSVRGAPSDGLSPETVDADTDIRSILRKELRKMG